jgi:hypothetical protein
VGRSRIKLLQGITASADWQVNPLKGSGVCVVTISCDVSILVTAEPNLRILCQELFQPITEAAEEFSLRGLLGRGVLYHVRIV